MQSDFPASDVAESESSASGPPAPALWRVPLLALAAVSLVTGLWGGLLLLGIDLPGQASRAAALHGPLMVFGFLGTLVTLERAVALGRPWPYAGPVLTGAGTLAALMFDDIGLGSVMVTAGGLVLLAAYVAIDRIQRTTHNVVMALGAVAWVAAAALWWSGAATGEFGYLLAGFVVLTIVGERIELSRAVTPPAWATRLLLVAIAIFVAGAAIAPLWPQTGARLAGAGLLAQALWLARFDVARRTVRMSGLTRFMAVALILGYAWLATGGAIWLVAGDAGGAAYDAALHAIFLGFAISMVFAHAPVIFPGVLRVPVPFKQRYYTHLALLHASLLIRIVGGDLAGNENLRQLGGVLNEAAIVLFLASTATASIAASREVRSC